MKLKLFLLFIFLPAILYGQAENVPVDKEVYPFLNVMSIKRIIGSINNDDPNLTRGRIKEFLKVIDSKRSLLSSVEQRILDKHKIEFFDSLVTDMNTTQFFNPRLPWSRRINDIATKKNKYLYRAKDNGNSIYAEGFGDLIWSRSFKSDSNENAYLFDGGFRFSGTVFKNLGYDFSVEKGGIKGNVDLAALTDTRLNYNFKFVENLADENLRSYDYANGYLRYEAKPQDDMTLAVQLGREQTSIGFNYSNSLVLSGNHPNLDFLKFNFDYGIMHYTSFFGSTVGEYSPIRSEDFSKYIAINRLKLAFPNLLDIGIGESVIFSDRLELAYLNPVIFYKFVEHSLQDRDNGTIYFDLQTRFMKNLQLQAMFFLDENILSNLQDMGKQSNKTAYQIGIMLYEPAGIQNTGITLEYTKIRPYVYSHFNYKNTHTSFGQIMGNPIGPNADQIYVNAFWNVNEWIILNAWLRHIRRGENLIDSRTGDIVKNVGGDVFQTFRPGVDSDRAEFLDGVRVNTDNVHLQLKIEPWRGLNFLLHYVYNMDDNITAGVKSDYSIGYLQFNLDY